MENLGIASVAAITVITYLMGMAVRASRMDNKWIPILCGLLGGLRASFLTGLVVILPIGLTIYLIYTVVGWIDSWILPLIPFGWRPDQLVEYYIGPDANFPTRGLGVIVFLIFTVVIGWIAKGLIGRSVIAQTEALVDRMPVVRSVYGGFKQITETFFAKSEKSFERTCLVEFPRPGSWAVGFVATTAASQHCCC